jgi:uncharacterized surface protein with fasciclin (FAS1) repeats
MKTKILLNGCLLVTIGILVLVLNRCEPVDYQERTNYQILIGQYLEENPATYSTFVSILDKSGSLAFLNAYGTYTCFAPTNAAFEEFFKEEGRGLDAFSVEELKDLVKYHIIVDTISSTQFTDGKLPTPSMYGQYHTTRAYFEGGSAITKVNKYAVIAKSDLRMLNGIIHSVKSVLKPVKKSIAELIESNSAYRIFSDGLKATGLYDTLKLTSPLNSALPRWFTVFVVPDSAYHKDGIFSVEDLKRIHSKNSVYTSPDDSLYLYMAYHIIDDDKENNLLYVSDIVQLAQLVTFVPNQFISVMTNKDSILLNEVEFAGVIERGYSVDRINSDNTSANGVFHVMENKANQSGNFGLINRKPTALYWEVTDQPEIRKMPGVFRKIGSTIIRNGNLANITWYGESNTIWYNVGDAYPYYVFNDYFSINLRPEVIKWIEFTTPILVKGRYKMWVCTRNVWGATNRKAIFSAYFNDLMLPTTINNQMTFDHHSTPEALELTGWKWYQINLKDSLYYGDTICTTDYHADYGKVFTRDYFGEEGISRYIGQLAGTVEVTATGPQKVKFVGITGTNGCWLDQIQFIPVENDQLWPRVSVTDGRLIYKKMLPPYNGNTNR